VPAGVPGSYEDVIRRAEKLFNRLRFSVAQQSAPTTLKASFLDPIQVRSGEGVLCLDNDCTVVPHFLYATLFHCKWCTV
jgi:hypothetical protein